MIPRSALVVVACSLSLVGCGGDDAPGGRTEKNDAGGTDGGKTGRLTEYAPPDALGPFPIGVTLTQFVDDARPELATADAADHRTLPTVVWYPASDAALGGPKATFSDALWPKVRSTLAVLAPGGFLDTPSDSVLDAPVADDGPFPLIVFSHGNSGIGAQSFFVTEYLASHGYIVVCPDHTGNALLTELPSGATIAPGGEGGAYSLGNATTDRVADVSFLVDAMTARNSADPDDRFTGKVDLEHVGLMGHSFGGLTTLLGMEGDPRFDVGSPMAPAAPPTSSIDRPVMYLVATEDRTLDVTTMKASYDALTAPKMYISITDAGHFSFSNGCPLGIGAGDGCGTAKRAGTGEEFTFIQDTRVHEITRYYQTALFGYYLKGIEGYAEDLGSERFAADATIERSGLP